MIKKRKGFTIIEIMIYLIITGMLLTAIIIQFRFATRTFENVYSIRLYDEINLIKSDLISNVHNANYFEVTTNTLELHAVNDIYTYEIIDNKLFCNGIYTLSIKNGYFSQINNTCHIYFETDYTNVDLRLECNYNDY